MIVLIDFPYHRRHLADVCVDHAHLLAARGSLVRAVEDLPAPYDSTASTERVGTSGLDTHLVVMVCDLPWPPRGLRPEAASSGVVSPRASC